MTEPDHPQYHPMIRDLPTSERPRERLLRFGASTLSNQELLALILRAGPRGENVLAMAMRLISQYKGLGGIARAPSAELLQQHGMGPAKTAEVLAAFELGKRLSAASADDRPQVTSPADAANLLMAEMSTLEQECLKVLLLDTKHRVQASPTIYMGNVNTSVVRVGELFREAVLRNSVAIIVAHNHPSGDPTPSPDDVRITEDIVKAGKLLNIEVLDHLVIGNQRYVSLKERGLGFQV
jgi:DNA repair protein RadC